MFTSTQRSLAPSPGSGRSTRTSPVVVEASYDTRRSGATRRPSQSPEGRTLTASFTDSPRTPPARGTTKDTTRDRESGRNNNREANKGSMDSTRDFLERELRTIFNSSGALTKELFSRNFSLQSPLGSLSGFQDVARALGALRALSKVDFTLRSLKASGDSELTARWSVKLKPRLPVPGQPSVTLTGRSIYHVDKNLGVVDSQRDEWDALPAATNKRLAAFALVLQQSLSGQTTPNLESPNYTLLKKAPGYEIRSYSSYLVAETNMPATEGIAGGTGFQDLAGYIFGGNRASSRMEMTTPVFSTSDRKMQFPMERKLGDSPEGLPAPNSDKVTTKRQEGGVYATASFPGIPLDFQVVEAERRLRALLTLDGLQPEEGYQLARYNDPFTLPNFRRNEVLIALKDFKDSDE